MIDHNLYDKELNNWIDNEKIAADLLNLTGQLMYDKGIEIVLFRQNILDVGVTELMRLVSYAENVVERKIELNTALTLIQEISVIELPPSKLDIGLLTAEYLKENKNYRCRIQIFISDDELFQENNPNKMNVMTFWLWDSNYMSAFDPKWEVNWRPINEKDIWSDKNLVQSSYHED